MSIETIKEPVCTCSSAEQAQYDHIERFEAMTDKPQPEFVSRDEAVQAMEKMAKHLKMTASWNHAKMRNISLSDMIGLMKEEINKCGIPKTVIVDNGKDPQ